MRKTMWMVSVLVAGVLGATAIATAGGGGGPIAGATFRSGGAIDTPSGKFLKVTAASFSAGAGPVVVRFSGEGADQDYRSDASFAGTAYAAMKVRVLLDGAAMSPGPVTFLDNAGQIGVKALRPRAASFEWAAIVTAGTHKVQVQFRNLHTYDLATLKRWTLTMLHA